MLECSDKMLWNVNKLLSWCICIVFIFILLWNTIGNKVSCWSLQYIKHKRVFWRYAILGCMLDCRVWSFVKPYPISPHEQCSTYLIYILLFYVLPTLFQRISHYYIKKKHATYVLDRSDWKKKNTVLSSELQDKLRPTSVLPLGI